MGNISNLGYIVALMVLGICLIVMGYIADRLRYRCNMAVNEYFMARQHCEKQAQEQLLTLVDDLYNYYRSNGASQDKIDGVDSTRAVIEFYFDRKSQGRTVTLHDLLELSKPKE